MSTHLTLVALFTFLVLPTATASASASTQPGRSYRLQLGASHDRGDGSGSGWLGVGCTQRIRPGADIAGGLELARGQVRGTSEGAPGTDRGLRFTDLRLRLGAAWTPTAPLSLTPGVWAGVGIHDLPPGEQRGVPGQRMLASGGAYLEGTIRPVDNLEFGPRVEAGLTARGSQPLSVRLSFMVGAIF